MPAPKIVTWHLEGSAESGERVVVRPMPFLIGRLAECHLRLSAAAVSSHHAEIFVRDGDLWLRDLDSTNGTFVNGEQVLGERRLEEADWLHFADQRFHLTAERQESTHRRTIRLTSSGPSLAPKAVRETVGFLELLRTQAVTTVYQAVHQLSDSRIIGYEALGRGAHPGAPTKPDELFRIGQGLGMSADLSRALRRRVLAECSGLPILGNGGAQTIFLNTHPSEITDADELLTSLEAFIAQWPEIPLVIELHEDSATDLEAFKGFRDQLQAIGVGQAFDDFGKGEERLEQLCEVKPDYVKFDRLFARDLHTASASRRRLVESLVATMSSIGVTTVVEGVESNEEASACRDVGFDLAQGYYFGYPTPLALLGAATES